MFGAIALSFTVSGTIATGIYLPDGKGSLLHCSYKYLPFNLLFIILPTYRILNYKNTFIHVQTGKINYKNYI